MNRPRFAALALAAALAGCAGDGDKPSGPRKLSPINFSGRGWHVKQYETAKWDPGPNYFSPTDENLWVDEKGWLHLRITKRDDGRWYCAELISDTPPGYGTYVFTVGSRADTLDPNAVLGLFTFDDVLDGAIVNKYRELDFELSRWGQPANQNAQMVVQPWSYAAANLHRFDIDNAVSVDTVHGLTWTASGVSFKSAYGTAWPPAEKDVISTHTYTGAATPTARNALVRLNLWLVDGKPPLDGQPQEMIVKRFDFIP
ncbi:MAG: hypothetical protein U0229_07185 [Anaeromyxobacter sp.]